jgi:hypothetical protein
MRYFSRLMLLVSALSLSACGETDGVPPLGDDPVKFLQNDTRGYAAPTGVMMGKDETPYWIASGVRGYSLISSSDRPAEIIPIKPNSGCAFHKPDANEVLAKVFVEDSQETAPIYAFAKDDIGERTKHLVKKLQKDPQAKLLSDDHAMDRFYAVDVVVTETSKPVYLVLAYSRNTLFNFHIAEGVKISRVAIIGYGNAAVANLDPSIPVASLTGETMRGCKATPFRKPQENWVFMQNLKEIGGDHNDTIKKNFDYARQFSSWFQQSFGEPAEPGMIGASKTSHVLVGPLPSSPETRAPFRSLDEALVRMTPVDYLVGSKEDYKMKNQALVFAQAEKLMGSKFNVE